jgi:hypothetical protein
MPANSLTDIDKTLTPDPLLTSEKLKLFYRDELNAVRGDDKVARLLNGLNQAYQRETPYKALLMGHPGVGKSTELTRLVQLVEGRFRVIRFSATREIDALNFKPFDIVLIMMAEIAERTAKSIAQGGAGKEIPEPLLEKIWDWFAAEKETQTQASSKGLEMAGGLGIPGDSIIAKTFGLFATLKGEIKYSANREVEKIQYRLNRLSTLIEVANELLVECNSLLLQEVQREWLFVGEDFEKPGIPVLQTENLFLEYSNIFNELQTHLIFTLPITLGYGEKASQLPFHHDRVFSIPDTPVFHVDHTPHNEGRDALRAVLEARVSLDLFEDNQLTRLIVASGGNLRDLFSLITYAGQTAVISRPPRSKISSDDVDAAIFNQTRHYKGLLGESLRSGGPISYETKAERLLKLYNQDPNAQIPDTVLYSLLLSRAVQEFGDGCFGVHPIVVDILNSQGRISHAADGAILGGTH